MPPPKPSKPKLATEIWKALFDFLIATRAQREEALGHHGLTPNDSRALFTLDQTGRTMQSLAQQWVCNPSNATWVVDRLERAGLAERRPRPGDRRVRLVALTRKGAEVREQLRAEFYRPPPELLGLDRSDLEILHLAVARLSRPHPVTRAP